MNNLISVVIPTYKGSDSLGIALQSVVNQTYKDFEIIVSDDNEIGSEEQQKTESIISHFKTKANIYYYKNGHHNGSYARNRGIEKTNGNIICLLDDDDYYLADHFKKTSDFFDSHSKIDAIFFDTIVITNKGTFKKVSSPNIDPKKLLFIKSEIGTGSNLCFRKKVANSLLFDERYLRHQDIEFAAKLMHKFNYYWIQETEIVKYYNNTDNYPNVEKALSMQKLLREDMEINNIINDDEKFELKKSQLHGLYNDLLAKNAKKTEITLIKKELQKINSFSFIDFCMFVVYSLSKTSFNSIFNIYVKKNLNNAKNDFGIKLLNYREELIKNI